MSQHAYQPRRDDYGRYNSPEHESLRAVARCFYVLHGFSEGRRRVNALMEFMGVRGASDLSSEGAHSCRAFLERQLPECRV